MSKRTMCNSQECEEWTQSMWPILISIKYDKVDNASPTSPELTIKPPLLLPKAAFSWLPLIYPDEQACALTIVASYQITSVYGFHEVNVDLDKI